MVKCRHILVTRFFNPQVKNMRTLSIKQAKHMPEYRAISERHDNAGFVLKKSDVFALHPMWLSHNICLKRIYCDVVSKNLRKQFNVSLLHEYTLRVENWEQ